jgi:hypothetical protein
MMSQKVNSISLRLNNRLSWTSSWSVKDKSYHNNFITNVKHSRNTKNMFDIFGLSLSGVFVWNTNKKTKIQTRLYSNSCLNQLFSLESTARKTNDFNQLSGVNTWLNYQSFRTTLKTLSAKRITKAKQLCALPIVSAQMVADNIAKQIGDESLRTDLLDSIVEIITRLFKNVKVSNVGVVSGLKVQCSGKWKQNASDRKQKITLTAGNISAQSYENIMSFGFVTLNTKLGACCVKVWLCYKFC